MVSIVGAGPGDPELITTKGLKLLQKADVVVYDRLVQTSLVNQSRRSAERIYVGKRAGSHSHDQNAIDRIIIDHAKQGKNIVRLKGGDPFLFGRGAEEAQKLKKARIPFTIVPGVTSAIAAPAYAGIPVTHRKYSSSVAIVTGHQDSTRKNQVDWKKIATAVDSIIILMGMGRLGKIVRELIAGGCKRNTKVAIIEWGTTPHQLSVTGTLSNIVKKVNSHKLKPPAIIVVGEVVGLHRTLNWFKSSSVE
ncbi:MAG: uroporphyrinogen-III C-methyltransferase [Candidatus Bathyarchaeia archaeon]|jgi:uroporphyrin-III C-methyltransferase